MADVPSTPIPAVKVISTIDPANAASPAAMPNEEPAAMVPAPQPAETVPQPGQDNLPPADSVIAKQAAEMDLFVVDAERDGQQLYLVVEGPGVEDVQSIDARKLAYDARFHYGFVNAGIEPHAGSEPVKATGRYRQTWKLTRGM